MPEWPKFPLNEWTNESSDPIYIIERNDRTWGPQPIVRNLITGLEGGRAMTTFRLNEGRMDRVARIVVGVILIAVGIAMMGTWGIVLGVIGLVPLFTGLTGWCPLYALFNINTCKMIRH